MSKWWCLLSPSPEDIQWLSSPPSSDHILPHTETRHSKSNLICRVFSLHILRFQVKPVQRMPWIQHWASERERERASDLWKAENYSPPHFCRRGKLNHKLSNEVKLESTIALYSPSRFTFHDGAALSHHHFSNPIDFYFSSSLDCFSSTSNIFQCQRFVLERRSLLLGQTFHSPKITLLPCQVGWYVLVQVEPQVWNPLDSCFLGNFSHFCHLD